MGIYEDYSDRKRREANEKARAFLDGTLEGTNSSGSGGGCIGGIFSFIFNLIWKPPVMLVVLLISIFILLPIKLVFYIISFGHWNGFEDKFISRIGDIYDY